MDEFLRDVKPERRFFAMEPWAIAGVTGSSLLAVGFSMSLLGAKLARWHFVRQMTRQDTGGDAQSLLSVVGVASIAVGLVLYGFGVWKAPPLSGACGKKCGLSPLYFFAWRWRLGRLSG